MAVDVAWCLVAAGACRDAVERLGRLSVDLACVAATAGDVLWAGDGSGSGDGSGDGDGSGHGSGSNSSYGDGGSGSGSGDGSGDGDGPGSGYGDGYGDGPCYGSGAGVVYLVIGGQRMTPADMRAWIAGKLREAGRL